jgi:virulence factor Mce-like protein
MVVFALSCFGLLLFLWLSFGGPLPLQPQGYRFQAAFPEAATLAAEADVRIAGVNVGKVKSKELDAGGARTITEIELDEQYAPIPEDTRAILRQKTLLGETYVELTPGDPGSGMLDEGELLDDTQVEPTVELDEILRIFDAKTQNAFREWVAEQAVAIEGGTSQDLNDALGNLPEFSESGSDVLGVLDEQKVAVKQLIRNTGTVFGALNEQEGALQELIVNSNRTFDATADEKEALAETIQVFPTFLRESRLTLARLETFSRDTRPLVNDLKPVARDLGPTVRDLGDLSPDLESVFRDFNPLTRSSRTTLPDAERFILGAEPVFEGVHTFLPELNPVLSFANFYRGGLADFLTVGGAVLNTSIDAENGEPADISTLPQVGLIGPNSLDFGVDVQQEEDPPPAGGIPGRPVNPFTRGNSYYAPGNYLQAPLQGIAPSFDCSQTGGIQENPTEEEAPCVEQGPYGWDGGLYPLIRGLQPPLVGSGRVPRPLPFPKRGKGLAAQPSDAR